MAKSSETGSSTWAAFAAGAVAMLLVVLIWSALSRMHSAAGALRADLAIPRATELPSLPKEPPPTGPKLPQMPAPGPR